MINSSTLKQLEIGHPLALIDLDAFDKNLATLSESVKDLNMSIRLATKSIRAPVLIQRALDHSPVFKGLMCYSLQEAEFLSKQGFDDLLVAYPTLNVKDFESLICIIQNRKKISLVVDDQRHVNSLYEFIKKIILQQKIDENYFLKNKISLMVEVDLSYALGPIWVGVRRSPIKTNEQAINLTRFILSKKYFHFSGIMTYEAHVAGVGDKNPFKKFLSAPLYNLRRYSMKKVQKARASLAEAFKKAQIKIEIFNGGGTGTLYWHSADKNILTEVTVGSGLLDSHLFDYYSNFKLQPAAYFALQSCREPAAGWMTCLGGGYVASGEPGWDRLPRLVEPDYKYSPFEGVGEVQTPVKVGLYSQAQLGDYIFFRPAKAGEWLERFEKVYCFKNNKLAFEAKTYRGHQQCYF